MRITRSHSKAMIKASIVVSINTSSMSALQCVGKTLTDVSIMFYHMCTHTESNVHEQVAKTGVRSSVMKLDKPSGKSLVRTLRSILQGRAPRKDVELALKQWGSGTLDDIKAVASMYACVKTLNIDFDAYGMSQDVFAVPGVTCDMMREEYRNLGVAFCCHPISFIKQVFSQVNSDEEMVKTLKDLIIALSPIRVVCPIKGCTVSILYAVLQSKRCHACRTLNMNCQGCAWSDRGDNVEQRLVSLLPHGPWDGYKVKTAIAGMLKA